MRLRESGVSWRRTGEEIVVLDIEQGEYFALNASGVLLWERLAEQPLTQDELQELLVSTYGIPSAQAEADVRTFVATLQAHGLVRE